MIETDLSDWDTLQITESAAIPVAPPDDSFYHHHSRLLASWRKLWAHREIVFTLAERDFRAQYKQATLGVTWALLSPVLTLAVMMIVFSRAKTFGTEGLPFALFAYVGILCWTFFGNSLMVGGNSLLVNKALLNKTQFPREAFPLETMLLNAVNTILSWVPLVVLFAIYGRLPRLATLWTPLFMLIEVLFAAGVTLAVAGVIIQMRDLVQVLPVIVSVGLFLEPVVWPLTRLPHMLGLQHGAHVTVGVKAFLLVYSFLNPLGPVIDNVRRTMLLGMAPDWSMVGLAFAGSIMYLVLGYKLFKRLEVQFADMA
jgi:ABC-type polysaccharide/polyol phosphate export permease